MADGYGKILVDAIVDSDSTSHAVSELQSVYEVIARANNTTSDDVAELTSTGTYTGEHYLVISSDSGYTTYYYAGGITDTLTAYTDNGDGTVTLTGSSTTYTLTIAPSNLVSSVPVSIYMTGNVTDTEALTYALATNRDVTIDVDLSLEIDSSLTTAEGGTGMCIDVPSNRVIRVAADVTLADGEAGSSGAIFGTSGSADNIHFIGAGGSIDGNKDNTSGTVITIALFNPTNCSVRGPLTLKNSSYFALGMRGTSTGDYGNIFIGGGLIITDPNDIGIQIAKPTLGFEINGVYIEGSGDNAIDVEGNNTSDTSSPYEALSIITNVRTKNVYSAVFLESLGKVNVSNITVDGFTGGAAFAMNRINSGSTHNIFTNIIIDNTDNATGSGIYLNNSVGYAAFSNIKFRGLANSFYIKSGVNNVFIGRCYHEDVSGFIFYIYPVSNCFIRSFTEEQIVMGSTYPTFSSPINNDENYSDRVYLTDISSGMRQLYNNTVVTDSYLVGTNTTVAYTAWSGAYAVYTSSQTKIYVENTPHPAAGEYLVSASGTAYLVASYSSGVVTLQDYDGTDGDYTDDLNSEQTITLYTAEWATD